MHIPAEQLQKAINEYKSGMKLLYTYEASNQTKKYEIQYYKMNSMERVLESLFGSDFINRIQNEAYSEYSNNI
jgi:hypothetical protein